MYKFAFSLLFMAMALHAATIATLPQGSGTDIDPYQIANLANLRWVSENSAYWGSSVYYVQTAHIDASETSTWNAGEGFSPIGNSTTQFYGTYHGRGYTITGLTTNRTTNFQGLFGYVLGGTIDSLGLEDVSIVGGTFVGALIGFGAGNIVSECYSSGKVTGSGTQIGGLIGGSGGDVSNSYSMATLSGGGQIGGLVGYNTGTILNSYASGKVTGSGAEIGGLVGTHGTATNSFFNSDSCAAATTYGTGKTTAELQTQATFSNWDFVDTWNIAGNSNHGFPRLAYQKRYFIFTLVTHSISLAALELAGELELGSYTEASAHGFCWNTTGNPTLADHVLDLGSVSSNEYFLDTLKNLSASTTYYVRAFAIAEEDTIFGVAQNFSTLTTSPGISTRGMGVVSSTDAIANGDLTWLGLDTLLDHGFCWSRGATPALGDSCVTLGATAAIGGYSSAITGLRPSTNYTVRAYAANGVGTVYGDAVQFRTMLPGSGTDAEPYLVADYDDLKNVGVGVNSLSGVYRLTADIDASPSAADNGGEGFVPIGDFSGKFHGGGHVINDLTINRISTKVVGLFATITSRGMVDSLGLVGGGVKGVFRVGNLAGLNQGVIQACYATGSVIANSESWQGDVYAGGLVGENTHEPGQVASITGSYATGAVIAKSNNSYLFVSIANAGGLVGFNDGNITESYATGSATSTGSYHISGGLVGANVGAVTASYWNKTTSEMTNGFGQSEGTFNAIGLTADEFVQSTSFVDLDFTNTWYHYNDHTYPLLRAFMTPLKVTAKDTSKIFDGTAFSGGNGVQYSSPNPKLGLIHGTLSYSGTSQGARNAGDFTISPEGLWSTQQGYMFTYAEGTLHINPKPITIKGVKASNKVYDASTAATLSGGVFEGKIPSDSIVLLAGTGSFDTKNVGNNKVVTASGYSFNGWNAENYILSAQPTGIKANITAKNVSVTGVVPQNKVYDGTTSSKVQGGALQGIYPNDLVGFTLGTAKFENKNAGIGKAVKITGTKLSGKDAANYAISEVVSFGADITPYPVVVFAEAKSVQLGDSAESLTYLATDLLGDDKFTGELTREKGNAVGSYKILLGTLSAGDNYEITYKSANYVITKTTSIDPVVPFAAFTGRKQAHIYNLQGVQVWSGMVDVNAGKVVMPNIGEGRWVVKFP